MPLTIRFFIKHIRPIDADAVNIICLNPFVIAFMQANLGGQPQLIRYWTNYISMYNSPGGPEELARIAHESRDEFGHVSRETVLFVTGAELRTLIVQSNANNIANMNWPIDFGHLVEARTAGDNGYMDVSNSERFNLGNDLHGSVNHLDA